MYVSVFTQMGISMAGAAVGAFVAESLEGIVAGYGVGILVGTGMMLRHMAKETTPEALDRRKNPAPVAARQNNYGDRCMGFFKRCTDRTQTQDTTEVSLAYDKMPDPSAPAMV